MEVKDNWVNIRATMDTGAAGHVMLAEMFPRVKLDRTSTTKKFVAASGEQIKDSGGKTIPCKFAEGVRRCIEFRSASVVKPLISMRKVVHAGNVVVMDEENPHIRDNRDGTVIRLDVNNGVYTVDMWVCLNETGPCFQLARTVSGSSVTNKLVRPRTKCSSEIEERAAEQELNGLEEGEDAMTDEEGEGVDGEGEAGTADWRVRVGPGNKSTASETEEHQATRMHFRDWCAHCMMGRGRTHHQVSKKRSEDLSRRPTIVMDYYFSIHIPL